MKISGLREKLGISDEDFEKLKGERIFTVRRDLLWKLTLARTGQLGHGVDHAAVARRRARNKAARKSRRINRRG